MHSVKEMVPKSYMKNVLILVKTVALVKVTGFKLAQKNLEKHPRTCIP